VKLVFYGGGDEADNFELDQLCMSLSEKIRPKMTYIPSSSYESEVYFKEFVNQYAPHGVTQFIHFPIDIPYDSIIMNEAFKADIIHLAGGNTYYFLKYLRKNGLIKKLKEFVANGGILTGLSAGAIIMTPNIETAGFPDFDRDENDSNLSNLKAMNLVRFEFFPHYKSSKRYDRELINYSKSIDIPVYACPDGSGIIVEDHSIKFHGRAYCFFQGKKMMINGRLPLKKYSSFEKDTLN
jgi:dipeptidase E